MHPKTIEIMYLLTPMPERSAFNASSCIKEPQTLFFLLSFFLSAWKAAAAILKASLLPVSGTIACLEHYKCFNTY